MRRIGARAITVVAILFALVGMLAFYVEHAILDEDGFETISLVVALVTPPIARGWLTALALIALVVAGIEVIRAIVHRESPHPD